MGASGRTEAARSRVLTKWGELKRGDDGADLFTAMVATGCCCLCLGSSAFGSSVALEPGICPGYRAGSRDARVQNSKVECSNAPRATCPK